MVNQGSQIVSVSVSLLLSLLISHNHIVEGKDLSSITYRFSTCGKQGRNGPTFTECRSHYQSTGSLLGEELSQIEGFIGGQEFTFPRSGRYGIRIAGAAGGRGVCSIQGGHGTVLSVEVDIEKGTNDTVLILVGQQGTSPCATNPDYTLCQNPPSSLSEAHDCGTDWSADSSGGGGGGGGSMIWPQNMTTSSYSADILPLVAAAGGGGTSVLLNYNSINDSRIPTDGQSVEEYYINWINGQPDTTDGLNTGDSGSTGNRPAGNFAGFGSGWKLPNAMVTIQMEDGNLLSQNESFAIGGEECTNTGPFMQVVGGFGGGGGGCGEGGGGGGYGGGWVLTSGNDIPGRGGYSLFTGLNATILPPNNGDGYVEIYPLDCGCSSGQCNINGEFFNCVCIGGATLASNNVSCLRDLELTPSNATTTELETPNRPDPVTVSLYQFEVDYRIHGARLQLSIVSSQENKVKREAAAADEATCVVVFVDSVGDPILISESNSTGDTGDIIPILNGSISSSPVSNLDEGVVVGGVMLLSEDSCEISSIVLNIDIDYASSSPDNITLSDIISTNEGLLQSIVSSFIPLPPVQPVSSSTISPSTYLSLSLSSTQTSSPSSLSASSSSSATAALSPTVTAPSASSSFDTTTLIIIIVVSVLAVLLLLVILVLILVVCRKRSSKKTIYQVHSRKSLENAAGGPTLQRRGTLQKIKTRIMSFTSNPNYGDTTIGGETGNDDIIDLALKETPPDPENSEKANLYESINLSNSLKRNSGIHGRVGSRKESSSVSGPFRLRSKSRRRTFTLKPKYGIMAPTYDFYEYNSKRPEYDTWEYDRTQLTYLREIGEGQFGKVLLMKAKNIAGFNGKLPVAVKTLSSIDEEEVKKFLDEVELMKKFCHPNIVSLLGVNSQHSEGAPLMILEYMPYGDLQSFLKRHKPKGTESSLIGSYHHKKFARDVALALNFLSKNHYVHRDVAARNCLVGPSLDVKLADFGMARGVHEKEYYRIAGRAVLPVRWMAPESLLYGMFSSASDVWSYGVLLWEIVTYGDMPLESLSPQQIVEMSQMQMLRHDWPVDSPSEDLMDIKDQCHNYEHEKRITFENIIELLPYATDTPAANT